MYVWRTYCNIVVRTSQTTFMSGLIEIGQDTLTETRGGDWFDFLANITGVVLGSIFSYYILRPYIWKRRNNK